MTAYRRPTMILQAILSCANQNYRPLEIDISDDSPTSDVQEAVLSFELPSDVSLRYRRNLNSLGEPENVNRLFREARGEYLILLHDDDMLLPGSVTRLVQNLSANPDASVAFGMQEVISSDGELDQSASDALNEMYMRDVQSAGVLTDPLLSALRHQVPNNGFMVRAEIARSVRYRTVEEIGRAGDTDYMIRIARKHPKRPYIFTPFYVSRYRLTQGSSRTQLGICWKLYDELNSLDGLTLEQTAARDQLVGHYAPLAFVDNATHGRRFKAARIFTTTSYHEQTSICRRMYHLVLLCAPALYKLRRFVHYSPTAT